LEELSSFYYFALLLTIRIIKIKKTKQKKNTKEKRINVPLRSWDRKRTGAKLDLWHHYMLDLWWLNIG